MLDQAAQDLDAVIALARGASREDWQCRALTALGLVANYARVPERMTACATEALAIAGRVGDAALQAEARALKRPPAGCLLHERRNSQFVLQVTGHPSHGLP